MNMIVESNLEIGDYRSDEGWRPRKNGNCPTLAARAREDGSGQPLLKIKSANKKGYQEAEDGDAIRLYQPNSETQRGRVGKGVAHTLETTGQQGVVQPNYNYQALNKAIVNHPDSFNVGVPKAVDCYNHSVSDNAPCLRAPEHNAIRMFDGYRIRRLTPIECERLQGFPDNHTEYGVYDGEVKKMSNTQRYKQCGNAVTVDVVKAVAEQLIPIYNA